MLEMPKLQDAADASGQIQALYNSGGIPAVIHFFASYSGEAILAESPEEKGQVQGNIAIITHALAELEADYQPELLRLWGAISSEAQGLTRIGELLNKLMDNLKSQGFGIAGINVQTVKRGEMPEEMPDPFEAAMDAIMQRFEENGAESYEIIPLSHFCESFQAWAVDAEEALRGVTGAEADVSVYNVMQRGDKIVCMVVGQLHDESQSRFKTLLPHQCLNDEKHFSAKHYEDMQEMLSDFLAKL